MTDEAFAAMVDRLEPQVRETPERYQRRVLLLAMLGNTYLVAILLLSVALMVLLFYVIAMLHAGAVKLIFVFAPFLLVLLKSLKVKIKPPQGTELSAHQAPQLFAKVDRLRRALGAPQFDHVLVTENFNAGVVQVPRLAVFGWQRNYLLIGLPLMKALTESQLEAVLAHEFGHLAKGHGSLSNWIYRQRLRWGRLLEALEAQRSFGSVLFRPFLKWFAPLFNAYSFPLARANEYAADAISVRLTSRTSAAEALTGLQVIGSFLAEGYWSHIGRKADDIPQPAFAPFAMMGSALATDFEATAAQGWLDRAMAEHTGIADTHPALRDRLSAIGEVPRLAPPAQGEASDRLLGSALADITAAFDENWRTSVGPGWAERFQAAQKRRECLGALDARAESGEPLPLPEALERAYLTATVGQRPDEALNQFQALYDSAPEKASTCFGLAAHLLQRDDGAGVPLMEQAMRIEEAITAPACEQLRNFHTRQGHADEARVWHRRLVKRAELEVAAAKERHQPLVPGALEPHQLPATQQAALLEQLRGVPGLRRVYLARRKLMHLPQRPFYVLGFCMNPRGPRHNLGETTERIKRAVEFEGETLIINAEGDNSSIELALRAVAGSQLL